MTSFMESFNKELEDAGELVETRGQTAPVLTRRLQLRDGVLVVTDGPYAETEEVLAGYWIVECESFDRATELAALAAARRTTNLPQQRCLHARAARLTDDRSAPRRLGGSGARERVEDGGQAVGPHRPGAAVGADLDLAVVVVADVQDQLQPALGQGRGHPVGPLHEHHRVGREHVLQAQVLQLQGAAEPVGVDVVDGRVAVVLADQHEGGGQDRPLDPEGGGRPLDQPGLARPEVAGQPDHVAGVEQPGHGRPDGLGGGLVG
jgi:hypothetical protein